LTEACIDQSNRARRQDQRIGIGAQWLPCKLIDASSPGTISIRSEDTTYNVIALVPRLALRRLNPDVGLCGPASGFTHVIRYAVFTKYAGRSGAWMMQTPFRFGTYCMRPQIAGYPTRAECPAVGGTPVRASRLTAQLAIDTLVIV
jgi:hypothetical protein